MRVRDLLLVVVMPALLFAQTTVMEVDSKVAKEHLTHQVEPVYPPIAKAAHVAGEVTLAVTIGETGKVIAAKALSGPDMLKGAALEAVRRWTYQPFLQNGAAVTATSVVVIPFSLLGAHYSKDEYLATNFFTQQRSCVTALRDSTTPTEGAEKCGQAAEMAEAFSVKERFIERRSAFVYAASAFLRNKQYAESLAYAQKAVDVVAQGHDDGSGSSAAFSVRAQAEAHLGNVKAADADLTTAEDFERSAIAKLMTSAPQLVDQEYKPQLKGMLRLHAQILSAMGDAATAQKKTDEAAAL